MISLKRFLVSPLKYLALLKDGVKDDPIQIVSKGHPIYVLMTQESYFRLLDKSVDNSEEGSSEMVPHPSHEEINKELKEFIEILEEE
jgi:hypothetical protein